ncbi:hypothetical protein AAC387_Pa12g2196 [Persea americana]
MLSWIASKVKGVTRHHLEGVGAAVAASIVIFYAVEIYRNRKKEKLVKHYSRSQSLGALHGGKVAVQRILEAQHARVDPSVLDGAEKELKDQLAKRPLDFSKLQSAVGKLEMSGKEEMAVKMLIEEHKRAEKDGLYHEAYELDMVIVEMLIYKGDFKEAWNRKCLQDPEISDARRPLYNAIIKLMQGDRRHAEECWKEFKAIRYQFQWPHFLHEETAQADAVTRDFEGFETTVQNLKKEIVAIHRDKKMTTMRKQQNL